MQCTVGGTGQVGSAVARALIQRGEPVTVVTRVAEHAESLRVAGARVAVADIRDVQGLHAIFRTCTRAFLLNPSADPAGDTDTEERATVEAMMQALRDSGLEKVVAASTYGAFAGERCGDLTVLHEFEAKLRAQAIPAAINRGAYYMSNWAGMLGSALETGLLPSFFPADFALPMVAPADLGLVAATRLVGRTDDISLQYVEGPELYSPHDVANAISQVFGRTVEVGVIPRTAWQETFLQLGYSEDAASAYTCMTSAVVDGEIQRPANPVRGRTSLRDYFAALRRDAQ